MTEFIKTPVTQTQQVLTYHPGLGRKMGSTLIKADLCILLGCNSTMFLVFPLFLHPIPTHMSLHLLSVKSLLSNYSSTYLSLRVQLLCLYMIPDLKGLTLYIPILAHKSCLCPVLQPTPVHLCLHSVCLYSFQETSAFIYSFSSLCLKLCVSSPCSSSPREPQVSLTTIVSLGCYLPIKGYLDFLQIFDWNIYLAINVLYICSYWFLCGHMFSHQLGKYMGDNGYTI